MSSRHIPGYFTCVSRLHKAKMACFLTLSKGTDEEERRDFIAFDLSREIEKTLDRFSQHPGEKAENLPAINRLVFGCGGEGEDPVQTCKEDWFEDPTGRDIILREFRKTVKSYAWPEYGISEKEM